MIAVNTAKHRTTYATPDANGCNKEREMANQRAIELAEQWQHWYATRRFFAPAPPNSVLGALMAKSRPTREPDGPMSAEMQAFNTALAAQDEQNSVPFLVVYLRLRTGGRIKRLSDQLGISRATFYVRAHKTADELVRMTNRLVRQYEQNIGG